MIQELVKDSHGFKSLVIDTADWSDKLCALHVCNRQGKTSIEDIGYGKGWVMIAEEWKSILDQINMLVERQGMHVVFLAHAQMRKFEQPDESGSYDRWEMKLEKKSSALLKEWADLVLFANYKTLVVEIDGKKKAQGGERVMYTNHHPCWDAKNRFSLPEELKFSIEPLKAIINACTKQNSVSAGESTQEAPKAPVAESVTRQEPTKTEPPKDEIPGIEADSEKAKLLAQLRDLMKSSNVTTEELGQEMARKGVCPAGMLPPAYNVDLLRRVTSNWSGLVKNIETIIRKGY
jgi:hypothetical protein